LKHNVIVISAEFICAARDEKFNKIIGNNIENRANLEKNFDYSAVFVNILLV